MQQYGEKLPAKTKQMSLWPANVVKAHVMQLASVAKDMLMLYLLLLRGRRSWHARRDALGHGVPWVPAPMVPP